MNLQSFFGELRRRRVFRVAAVYAVVAWLVIQIAETTFPYLSLPGWTITFVIVLALLGFPIALVLAWAFDITPEGVRRTESLPGSATPSGRLPGRTAGVLGLGILVGLVAIGSYTGIPSPAGVFRGEVSPTSVAVLPFAVRGSPDLAYLREGMVSLLATKLDGAGELRSVDPHALLKRAGEQGAFDPAQASALAADFGAGLYILGNVVESGRRLHLNAFLYDVAALTPIAQAGVEGSADQLFALVDQLAVELLSTRLRRPEAGLGRAADLTTHSLPALRAFLHGERERRAFDVDAAIEAYQRAVQEDSTFALAHLRLTSLGWAREGRTLMRPSLEAALRYQQRLSQRDRLFLEAQSALLNSPLEVERLVRNLTVRYPEDVEGWSLLGDLLFHGNPQRGRSRSEAREALERALALDPDYREPLVHTIDLAAMEGRYTDLRALTEQWGAAAGLFDGQAAALKILAHYGAGTEAERQDALAELRAAEAEVRWSVFFMAALFGPPELLREALDIRGEILPAFGSEMDVAVHLALWGGAPQQAIRRLNGAQPADHGWRVARESWIAVLPFFQSSAADLTRLRTELLALPAGISPLPEELGAADWQRERLWLLGALSVRLNDLQAADRYARELERLEGTDAYSAAARVRRNSLRALLARAQGRPAEALRLLENVEREMFSLSILGTGSSPTDFTLECFLRAELLRELGREEEALLHYPVDAYSNPVFHPISHLRVAEILERTGQREKAIHHHTFFTLLWRDADPELRRLVEQAERRLAALRRG